MLSVNKTINMFNGSFNTLQLAEILISKIKTVYIFRKTSFLPGEAKQKLYLFKNTLTVGIENIEKVKVRNKEKNF